MQIVLKGLFVILIALGIWAMQTEVALAQEAASPLPSPEEMTQLLSAFDVPGLAMATLTGCERVVRLMMRSSP